MTRYRVAVLGGDGREVHIAERLAEAGHETVRYGQVPGPESNGARVAASPEEAVRGTQWVVCPFPGLDGSTVYAPGADQPIVLEPPLLRHSSIAEGGLILGRSTTALDATASELGIRVFEMKDDRALATQLSTGVAEGVIRLLIELTRRILREHRFLVVGYGVTGAVILDYLVGARCEVAVAARGDLALQRARQCGATPVTYAGRVAAMAAVDIVINTVPSPDAVPSEAFAHLGNTMVVDIASPPGGLDHEAARARGVSVHWPRGLAGGRAPLTAGDAQYGFVARVMAATPTDMISSHAVDPAAEPSTNQGAQP